jgi:hypothetical protein
VAPAEAAQALEVVAPFEEHDLMAGLDERAEVTGEVGEVPRGEAEAGDRIAAVTVVAGRDQQPRRLPGGDQRGQHVLDGGAVDVAGGA